MQKPKTKSGLVLPASWTAEEARIRADPLARGTALLEKVFGYAASRAQ
jgi:hypothetical protein